MSSSSSSDEIDERLDEVLDEIVEDAYNDIVEAQPNMQNTRGYIERDREGGHTRLVNDYFRENATYSAQFRRRFRMNKGLFMRIVLALQENFVFFQQRQDATGRLGHSPLQKCTAAIRLLAYGTGADTVDEYLRLAETSALLCLHNFTDGIIQLFGDEYLRAPTPDDLQRLLDIGEKRGFPGMIGSIDCMHWEWKNCPTAWKGQYARGSGKPTIVLEAVASQDLWIWHAFFGPPGTLNDINVLDRSPLFDDILEGRAPRVKYMVNGHMYKLAYYLTDGIYPKWSTFIQSISLPQSPKQELFAKHQEATRKDVERAFGVLQARFAIVRNPALTLDKAKIGKIMRACIILHNMIVEDERDGYIRYDISEFEEGDVMRSSQVETEIPTILNNIFPSRNDVRDRRIHDHLKNDLVEHIWNKFGDED
ncbi:putative nuclease HARBI1 [Brassica napus]|uniref:putative nuclease HARBI1 n=1 Tax=Brassica napus TaxID=3708 RepID=UPI002078A6B3|nr:putative nuclease HARBI1 [Brassica napus]